MLLLDRTTSRFSPVSRSIRSILSVRASHQYSFPSYRPEAPPHLQPRAPSTPTGHSLPTVLSLLLPPPLPLSNLLICRPPVPTLSDPPPSPLRLQECYSGWELDQKTPQLPAPISSYQMRGCYRGIHRGAGHGMRGASPTAQGPSPRPLGHACTHT